MINPFFSMRIDDNFKRSCYICNLHFISLHSYKQRKSLSFCHISALCLTMLAQETGKGSENGTKCALCFFVLVIVIAARKGPKMAQRGFFDFFDTSDNHSCRKKGQKIAQCGLFHSSAGDSMTRAKMALQLF